VRRIAGILVTAATVALAVTGCGNSTTNNGSTTATGSSAPKLKVALILGGLGNDGSFNQYAYDVVKKFESQGVITARIHEQVAGPAQAEPLMNQYGSENYDLIIGWGLGFADSVFKVAKNHSKANFIATGGPDLMAKTTDNLQAWTYDFNQFGYLSGYIAGKSGLSPIGIVEGLELPFVVADDIGFKAGALAANPSAKVLDPVIVGSFDDAQKASQATKGLIKQGVKLVFTGGDGITTGIASAAADANIATIGITGSAGGAAAKVNIASVRLDLTPAFQGWVDRLKAGTFGKAGTTSTIANGGLVLSPVNRVAAAPDLPKDLQEQAATLAADLASGKVKLPDFSTTK
jgi:basic membrane protein A